MASVQYKVGAALKSSARALLSVATIVGFSTLSVAHATQGPALSDCPSAFYSVPLTEQAKQCQLFEDDFPASMIYHDKRAPESLIAYYQATQPEFEIHSAFNERTLLIDESQNLRVVISPDGQGSQIDILVLTQ